MIRCMLVFALMLVSSHAYAADECDGMVVTSTKITWSGQELIAMPPAVAACLAKRAEQKVALEAVVAAQTAHSTSQDKLLNETNRTLAAAKELVNLQQKRGDEFKQLAEAQASKLEALGSWYHSPLFWAGVGAAAALLVIAIVGTHPVVTVNSP